MIVRRFEKGDDVTHLLEKDPTDVDPQVDEAAVLEAHKKIVGISLGRPVVWVHQFSLAAGSRRWATRLFDYGMGLMRGRGEKQMMFMVSRDNYKMQRFLEEQGATRERDGIVYRLEIR